jgi:hypothetical protein
MDNTILNEKEERGSSLSSASVNHVAQFEDYLYFAALQRLAEETTATNIPADEAKEQPQGKGNWLTRLTDHKGQNVNVDVRRVENPPVPPPTVDELERENTSRALRLASWSTVFYLITTDILGPFNAPYAIAQVGLVPGISNLTSLIILYDFYYFFTPPGILLYVFSMRIQSRRDLINSLMNFLL